MSLRWGTVLSSSVALPQCECGMTIGLVRVDTKKSGLNASIYKEGRDRMVAYLFPLAGAKGRVMVKGLLLLR